MLVRKKVKSIEGDPGVSKLHQWANSVHGLFLYKALWNHSNTCLLQHYNSSVE